MNKFCQYIIKLRGNGQILWNLQDTETEWKEIENLNMVMIINWIMY